MKMQITAMVPKSEGKNTAQLGPVTIEVETGATAAEMVQMFGDEAVKSNAEANWAITLQSNIRAALKRGETGEQSQARLEGAKLGVAQKGAKIDPIQAYLAMFASATPDKQAAMLADLKKKAVTK
jgi:uncharacterized lipoprotein YmbA